MIPATDVPPSYRTTSRLASRFLVMTSIVLHIRVELVSMEGGIPYLNATPLPRKDSGGLLVKKLPSKRLLGSINRNGGDGMQRVRRRSTYYIALDEVGFRPLNFASLSTDRVAPIALCLVIHHDTHIKSLFQA